MKNNFCLIACFVSLLLFSACSKKDAKLSSTGFKQDLRLYINADVPSFNYYIDNDANLGGILSYVYDSLLNYDQDTYELIPAIAKTFKVSEDKMSFEFEIDERATWFDGKAITSADVEFTLKTIFDPKNNTASSKAHLSSIDPNIKIIDERRFVIKAKTVHHNNLSLAGAGYMLLPKHLLEGKDFNRGPLLTKTFASGPYNLSQWKKGDRIILEKNPNYWGRVLPQHKNAFNFKRIIFKVVQEPKIALQYLKSGFWSGFNMNSEQWKLDSQHEKIQKNYHTYRYQNKNPSGFSFIAWNLKNPLFAHADTRKALGHLLNRKFMIEKFSYGLTQKAIGPLNRSNEFFPQELEAISYDPAKASELLRKVGWKDSDNDGVLDRIGKNFEFSLIFSGSRVEKFLTVYKEDLKKVGIVCNLKKVDWTLFTKLMDERKFDALTMGWSSRVEPDFEQIWHSNSIKNGGSNFVSYSNPEVDVLIKDIQKEFDRSKRKILVQKTIRLIAADAPYSFMFESPNRFVAVHKEIKKPKDYYPYSWGIKYWTPQ